MNIKSQILNELSEISIHLQCMPTTLSSTLEALQLLTLPQALSPAIQFKYQIDSGTLAPFSPLPVYGENNQ